MNVIKSAIKSFLTLFALCRLEQIQTTSPITLILFIVFLYIYGRFSHPSFEYKVESKDPIHAGIMSFIFTIFTMCATCYTLVDGLTSGFFCLIVWTICILGFLTFYYHVMIWLYTITSSITLDTVLYPNKLLPYIDDMPTLLKASDIAISRSGSLSLSEIKASEVASILIPYPYSSGNHQKINAQAMVDLGCSIMVEDFELDSEKLYEIVSALIKDNQKLKNMQKIAFGIP